MPQHLFGRFARAWWPAARFVSLTAAAVTLAATISAPASAGLRTACRAARPGYMRCLALYRTDGFKPAGLTPRQIEAAYRLPVSQGGADGGGLDRV